ncbi:MAG TPA: hypothetical protein VMF30_06305 [Pirellulales bacterium]|nr:hypothetical protein [Pirellulales bacterium]
MGRRTVRETGSFRANYEDGREITIYIFTEFLEIESRAGSSERAVSMSLKTAEGNHVNPRGGGRFEIVGVLSSIVTSTDPNAPQ